MAISITPSPFGSVTVTLDGELGGVLSVSVLATSNSVLDMAIGTPGPAGATGATGATGAAGVGVPVGGTTSQALVKVSGTNYDTTWAGPFLDLAGGTLSGTLFLPGLRNLLNTDLTVTAYNDTGAGTNFIHTFDAFDGTFALATNGGGLKFPDATVQTTAALPLTGGTVTGAVTINDVSSIYLGDGVTITDLGQTLILTGLGITFPDSTTQTTAGLPLTGGSVSGGVIIGTNPVEPVIVFEVGNGIGVYNFDQTSGVYISPSAIFFPDSTIQSTAFPPSGGTTLQFIDGTGALQTTEIIPTFATTAQAQAGTSTTTVISPSTLLDAKFFAGYKLLTVGTWTSATSGAGAFASAAQGFIKSLGAPTSAIGHGYLFILNSLSTRGLAVNIGADFTKRTTIGGRFIKTVTTADANTIFRFTLGKFIPTSYVGDLAGRGIGFRQVANGALELQVHNGTTLYNVTSTFTPTANQSYDVVIVADAGTATMFVNGSSVATSANAPTAVLGANNGAMQVEAQNTAILSGSTMTYSASDMFVQTNL